MTDELKNSQRRTLEKFMERAGLVASHSVARGEKFRDLARGRIDLLPGEGGWEIRSVMPDNEEAFESFAIRVRPVTLESEDIYYDKILEAIDSVDLEPYREQLTPKFFEVRSGLRNRWENAVNPAGDEAGFISFQYDPNADGRRESVATMHQLAESWMYTRVAHTNVKARHRDGLDFSRQEQYRAAVSYYSRLASVTLDTAHVIAAMSLQQALPIDTGPVEAFMEIFKEDGPGA